MNFIKEFVLAYRLEFMGPHKVMVEGYTKIRNVAVNGFLGFAISSFIHSASALWYSDFSCIIINCLRIATKAGK